VQHRDAILDDSGLADHDARAMVDEDALADHRAGMNVEANSELDRLCRKWASVRRPSRPQPVRCPVGLQRVIAP
jgi:alpha-D-ribose 1-methylphosphonate 5-triphosphate synthase subunit PhnG